jgi:indole-3-glycerol phosphate synthase
VTNILDDIIAEKREEVQQRQSRLSLEQLRAQIAPQPRCRNFYKAVTKRHPRGLNVIAEVKKASPSAGVIRADFDPVAIARIYERCGADAISVLTDEKYFQGRLEYLEQVKRAVSVPVLRKDFIIDVWQVYESRAAGADAILLIAEALRPGDLIDLMIAAAELGLTVLGINNRDLATMNVDIRTTARLSSLLDDDYELVSESGIKTREDVRKLKSLGVRAILVGQSLCGDPDIEGKFRQLFDL